MTSRLACDFHDGGSLIRGLRTRRVRYHREAEEHGKPRAAGPLPEDPSRRDSAPQSTDGSGRASPGGPSGIGCGE